MTILFLALWLQMSAPQTGIVTLVKTCNVAEWVNGEITCKDPQGWHMVNKPITPGVECGYHSDGSYTDCCGAMMKTPLNQEYAEAAQRAADETDGKPHTRSPAAMDGWYLNPDYKKPSEPVDVPAVQVTKSHNSCVGYIYASPDLSGKERDAVCMVHTTTHTCADKSRILEHDENSPPKYWCRKVQP